MSVERKNFLDIFFEKFRKKRSGRDSNPTRT